MNDHKCTTFNCGHTRPEIFSGLVVTVSKYLGYLRLFPLGGKGFTVQGNAGPPVASTRDFEDFLLKLSSPDRMQSSFIARFGLFDEYSKDVHGRE